VEFNLLLKCLRKNYNRTPDAFDKQQRTGDFCDEAAQRT
jgi:hypothetical protein